MVGYNVIGALFHLFTALYYGIIGMAVRYVCGVACSFMDMFDCDGQLCLVRGF